jgi:hypothetical protein
MKTILVKKVVYAIVFMLILLYGSCTKEEKPVITGCDSFTYNGEKYNSCCSGSPNAIITNFGYVKLTERFSFECSNGCIKSGSLKLQ